MNLGKESETLEFKKTTGELKEAMISISSILNKHGVGTLYFGVKPNGDVDGQDVTESSLRDVSRFVYPRAHRNTCPAGRRTSIHSSIPCRTESVRPAGMLTSVRRRESENDS